MTDSRSLVSRGDRPPVLELRGPDEVIAITQKLGRSARREYLHLHHHPGAGDPMAPTGRSGFGEIPDRGMLERGVELRLLHTYDCLRHPTEAEYLGRAQARGARVRLTGAAPLQLTVVDRRTVLLPLDPRAQEQPQAALLIRDPALVNAMHATHSALWAQARTLPRGLGETDDDAPVELQPVLDALLSGLTDAAAARRLNMAPRTYSRRVTQLLDELGATTRAQAGAEACRRGWAGPER